MRQSAHFKASALLLLLPFGAVPQQPGMLREGDHFVREFSGTAPAARRLRVNAHGPVSVQAGTSNNIAFTVRVSVRARTEAEARNVMQRYNVRLTSQGEWVVLTAPGGPIISTVTVKAPRVEQVIISTSDGGVEASGIDGSLDVDTGAGELTIDRIGGDCKLVTGGGDIKVGSIGGGLKCSTGAGRVQVGAVRGPATLETIGGDISANDIGGILRADTGGGGIHIIKAGAAVSASTGGGQIVIDSANGIVTARNMAGPVKVGAASGVQCESGTGGINVSNISGGMRVSTALGNIMASLLAGRLADSYLASGNGDITVFIPSNVGVNVRAQNDLADSTRRINVDFPGINVRRQGRLIVAEGPVNGGGPLLQISATVGTIFIRKQP
ncbi:MAG: hypothetical protein ABI806_24105 [Candidatus Solibacter sp.]